MTGPEGNSEFCFPRISMFPETKSREALIEARNKGLMSFQKLYIIQLDFNIQKQNRQNKDREYKLREQLQTNSQNNSMTQNRTVKIAYLGHIRCFYQQ